ncbi:Hypothetical predicted protein [Octopus vulgaris]|uniref:SprT-like domain-containing protein n=1 Tax=Octopus vulgaris TaxID=6645 RepID=A0AA36C1Y1_OCTVU|nr:Hypothetical predicted protein [Octopus vulgaris]
MSLNDVDVDEMFLQMSEKLGWLQLGDVDSAISSLTKKQKHKKSAKKGSTTKNIGASSKNSIAATSLSTSSKVKKSKPTTKKQGGSGKSDVISNGDCNDDAVKVASKHKKNTKTDSPDETGAKILGKIHVGLESQQEKNLFLEMSTLECLDSQDLTTSNNGYNDNDDDEDNKNDDYDDKIGEDKTSLVTSVFSQPPKPHSPSCQHSDDSNSNSLKSPSDLSVSDDLASMTSICKKISFASDDSTTERSLNSSDSASNTSNTSNTFEKSPLTTTATTIPTPPAIAETVKMSEIPSKAVLATKPSLGTSATPRKIQSPCSTGSSIQRSGTNKYFGKEDGSSKDTDGFCNKETQPMPSSTNKTPFSVEEFFISDDDDNENDDYIVDCDDGGFQDYTPSRPDHQLLSDIKSGKKPLNNSGGFPATPLAALKGRRCQSELRPQKYFSSNNNNNNADDKQGKQRNLPNLLLSSDSSSDDDNTFEAFLTKMKTPARKKPTTSPVSMDVFIVSDSESSSENSDSDDKYSVSLYHRIRPISPGISPFKGSFDNNPPSSVCKENPRQSNTCEKRSTGSMKPIKDAKPKPGTKTGKHGVSGGDDGVFRKPSVFPSTSTNSSTGSKSKSTVTGLKTPVLDKRSTPVNNVLPNVPRGGKVPQTCPTLKYLHQAPPPLSHKTNKQCQGDGYTGFLESLSESTENLRYVNEEARKFVKYFKQFRLQLVKKLFAIYNETIFDNRFPVDFPIVWNKRLLTTAGHCKLTKKTNTLSKTQVRSVEVNLATKVCDTAERVRDTLIHELCHAAVWLFNGSHEGHGALWKSWARRANRRYPSALPIIERCHSYKIAKKYTYKCVRCGYSFGRHSKSLDTTKKVCGYCRGRFVLVTTADSTRDSNKGGSEATPARTPNKFALFVKEHYGNVKKSNSCSHKDVMNILSQKFKEAKIC